MNALSSECGSGCESGWTLYFEHSLSNKIGKINGSILHGGDPRKKNGLHRKGFEEEEEEEDLSMVSDASSGPPLHCDVVDGGNDAPRESSRCTAAAFSNCKRQKIKNQGRDQDFHSLLDDTASSPVITNDFVGRGGVEIPDGRSAYQDRFGLLHTPIAEDHDNQWFGRKNMKWR